MRELFTIHRSVFKTTSHTVYAEDNADLVAMATVQSVLMVVTKVAPVQLIGMCRTLSVRLKLD